MKNKITINKTAFYHTLGEVESAKTIWFVLHGYGYLAEYFINKFKPILNGHNAIIAPEGLSKFYLNGVGYDGRIGASWMTKDNRETEIKDYIRYLEQLYQSIIELNVSPNLKINVVGFSQGGATGTRWIANQKSSIDNFILWSSSFAEDIDINKLTNGPNLFALYGDDDEFISNEKIDEYEAQINSSSINCKLIRFAGKHDIPKEVLVKQTELNDWK